jgi:hypothetical protein
MEEAEKLSNEPLKKINFDDKYLNIKGYYMWKSITKETKDNNNRIVRTNVFNYIELNILKQNKTNVIEIIKKIDEYLVEKNKEYIKLEYIKIFDTEGGPSNHVVTFYSGKKLTLNVLESKYIRTFSIRSAISCGPQ